MEAINAGISISITGAKFIYDHRKDIKNFISKHSHMNEYKNEEFIDDEIPDEIHDLKIEDEYKSDTSNDEMDDLINKHIKKQANKIIDEHPIHIPQNVKSSGFNPISSLMNTIKRNITPDRQKTPIKTQLSHPLQLLVENIIKFLIFEIQSQNIENSELQTYQQLTRKMISLIQNSNKKIKLKSI
jgi:hypothetical protein